MDTATEPLVRDLTENATPGGLMQDALDILYNPEADQKDIDRARILVTAAREMRIASGKRSRAYSDVELAFELSESPREDVTIRSHAAGDVPYPTSDPLGSNSFDS